MTGGADKSAQTMGKTPHRGWGFGRGGVATQRCSLDGGIGLGCRGGATNKGGAWKVRVGLHKGAT